MSWGLFLELKISKFENTLRLRREKFGYMLLIRKLTKKLYYVILLFCQGYCIHLLPGALNEFLYYFYDETFFRSTKNVLNIVKIFKLIFTLKLLFITKYCHSMQ